MASVTSTCCAALGWMSQLIQVGSQHRSSYVHRRDTYSGPGFLKKCLLSYRRDLTWHLVCWMGKGLLSHKAAEPSNALALLAGYRSFGTLCQGGKKKSAVFLYPWKTIWQNLVFLTSYLPPLRFLILWLPSRIKAGWAREGVVLLYPFALSPYSSQSTLKWVWLVCEIWSCSSSRLAGFSHV